MTSPPAKFWRFPLSAIPIATPADARSAANDVISTPSAPITERVRSTRRRMLTRLDTNDLTARSTLRFSSVRAMRRLMNLIT